MNRRGFLSMIAAAPLAGIAPTSRVPVPTPVPPVAVPAVCDQATDAFVRALAKRIDEDVLRMMQRTYNTVQSQRLDAI